MQNSDFHGHVTLILILFLLSRLRELMMNLSTYVGKERRKIPDFKRCPAKMKKFVDYYVNMVRLFPSLPGVLLGDNHFH